MFSHQMKGKEQISVEIEASKGSGQEGISTGPGLCQWPTLTPSPTSCFSGIFLESSSVVSAAQGRLAGKHPDSRIHSSFPSLTQPESKFPL